MNSKISSKDALRLSIVILAFLAVFVCFADDSSAATINVGSGAGNQSSTIQGAVDSAGDNDIINVHRNGSGTYHESVSITKSNLTLKTATGEHVQVSTTTNLDKPIFYIKGTFSVPVQYVNLNGFDIIGDTNLFYPLLRVENAEFCNITNNNFTNLNQFTANVEVLYISNNHTISNNNMTGGSYGIYKNGANPSNGNKYLNNNISNCKTGITITGSSNTTISNNNITLPELSGATGIFLGVDTVANQVNVISNNIVTKALKTTTATTGIYVSGGGSSITNNQIYSNNVTNQLQGFYIGVGTTSNWINDIFLNRIFNNTYGMKILSIGTLSSVNATNNWWGKNTVPTLFIGSTTPTTNDIWRLFTGGTTDGLLSYDPWIVLNVSANPTTIPINGNSVITADLTKNSNNEDTTTIYAGKTVPDGIQTIFATSLGTIGSPSSTVNGLAQSTLNGGATPGVADVSAAVDSATVHTSVNVETPTPPVVSSVDPANGATNVPTNKVITVTFSKPIQAGSSFSNITVRRVSDNASMTINKVISGNTLTITIPTAWQAGTQYKLFIPKTAITDLLANSLTASFTSFFTTTSPPPAVSSVDPANGAVNVPVNKVITVTFSKLIQAGSSYSSITVRRVSDNVSMTINKVISGNTLTITIPTAWQAGTQYKLFIPSAAITDLTANTLTASFTSFFTTTAAPAVSSIDPANGAVNVPVNKVITVTFSKLIQAGSSYSSITVRRVSDNVSMTINKVISGNTLTITVPTAWQAGTQYKLFIPSAAITDLTANTLTASFTSFYTTI